MGDLKDMSGDRDRIGARAAAQLLTSAPGLVGRQIADRR